MKNLLIFINPNKGFNDGYNSVAMAETQIDNSLRFWKKEDILLVTNFPYEYHGVKALVVDDSLFCTVDKKASKINTIIYLLEHKLITDLTWFHDLDAFQLQPFTGFELDRELGLTDYGWKPQWNTGSIFFRPEALDIFKWIKEKVYQINKGEEEALTALTDSNFNNINSRYRKLNSTYNIGMRKLNYIISIAEKPIKVVHFPPQEPEVFGLFQIIIDKFLIELIKEKFYWQKGNMKNLMIYINPQRKFFDEKGYLVKIQIDNLLDLGWKKEDIVLVTNFPYQYGGIESMVVPDSFFCTVHDKASKINVIHHLITSGQVKRGELWWFHDFDNFQVYPVTEEELGLEWVTAGFTDYGWMKKWNTGSMFFRRGAIKIFEWLRSTVYNRKTDEERALVYLTDKNYQYINNYCKRLNVTYNFPGCLNGERNIAITYKMATKPVKVLHFHPVYRGVNYLHVMCGKNRMNLRLIPDRLLNIFKKHIPELCPAI